MKKYIGKTKTPVKYKVYEAWFCVSIHNGLRYFLTKDGSATSSTLRAEKYTSLKECPVKSGFKRELWHLINGTWSQGKYKG